MIEQANRNFKASYYITIEKKSSHSLEDHLIEMKNNM